MLATEAVIPRPIPTLVLLDKRDPSVGASGGRTAWGIGVGPCPRTGPDADSCVGLGVFGGDWTGTGVEV